MAIELVGLGEVMKKATKNSNAVVDLNDLRVQFLAKEKAAEAALEEAEKATLEAEELRIKLAEAVAKDEECSEAEVLADETSQQKIARLEKELADAIIIRELEDKLTAEKAAVNVSKVEVVETTTTAKTTPPKPTAKVDAEKLNVTTAPKVEVTTEVYEPEAPKSGAKGAAARRK